MYKNIQNVYFDATSMGETILPLVNNLLPNEQGSKWFCGSRSQKLLQNSHLHLPKPLWRLLCWCFIHLIPKHLGFF